MVKFFKTGPYLRPYNMRHVLLTGLFLFLALLGELRAQYTPLDEHTPETDYLMKKMIFSTSVDMVQWIVKPGSQKGLFQKSLPNFNNRLPFFCNIEHEVEKSSKVPLRIRLGSLDYVDILESKNHFDQYNLLSN